MILFMRGFAPAQKYHEIMYLFMTEPDHLLRKKCWKEAWKERGKRVPVYWELPLRYGKLADKNAFVESTAGEIMSGQFRHLRFSYIH